MFYSDLRIVNGYDLCKREEDNFVKIISDMLTNRRCCPHLDALDVLQQGCYNCISTCFSCIMYLLCRISENYHGHQPTSS